MWTRMIMCQLNMHVYLHFYKLTGHFSYLRGARIAKKEYERLNKINDDLGETKEIA